MNTHRTERSVGGELEKDVQLFARVFGWAMCICVMPRIEQARFYCATAKWIYKHIMHTPTEQSGVMCSAPTDDGNLVFILH